MDPWVIRLVFAVVPVVAELFSFTAACGVLGGAALVTAGASALSMPVVAQLGVFALASIAGLLVRKVTAERQSQILTAEGDEQTAVLRAEGNRTARILRAEAEAKAIDAVVQARHGRSHGTRAPR